MIVGEKPPFLADLGISGSSRLYPRLGGCVSFHRSKVIGTSFTTRNSRPQCSHDRRPIGSESKRAAFGSRVFFPQ